MNRDEFVINTLKLVGCAHSASLLAASFGCDIDCEGFIGDLITGYGDLILKTAVNNSNEKYEKLVESFWNDIVYKKASLTEIKAFYDERIAKE